MKQMVKKLLIYTGASHPLWWWLCLRGILKYDRASRTFVRNVLGHRMHLNGMDHGLCRKLAVDGIREAESVELMRHWVKPDMNILDLGANIGFYVLIEAGIIKGGKGRIVAVEPISDNLKLLKLNVLANHYQDRVQIISGAVTPHSGTTKLALAEQSNCHKLADLVKESYIGPTETVRAYTLSEILKVTGIDNNLDFLRMDVEGAEYTILSSLLEELHIHDTFLMFIEFHPSEKHLQQHKAFLRKLETMEFRCLGATKEYPERGTIRRISFPKATIQDLYTDPILLRDGGCEVFLGKGYLDGVPK